jgi:hypothetical protein
MEIQTEMRMQRLSKVGMEMKRGDAEGEMKVMRLRKKRRRWFVQ